MHWKIVNTSNALFSILCDLNRFKSRAISTTKHKKWTPYHLILNILKSYFVCFLFIQFSSTLFLLWINNDANFINFLLKACFEKCSLFIITETTAAYKFYKKKLNFQLVSFPCIFIKYCTWHLNHDNRNFCKKNIFGCLCALQRVFGLIICYASFNIL